MMRLNMDVPVEFTHRLLPQLRKAPKSYVLNVGSMAGYNAFATLGTYSASKSFILRSSRSLRMESARNRRRGLLCLSRQRNNRLTERAGMQVMDELAKRFGRPPEPVAEAALKALFAGKPEVVPGFSTRIRRDSQWASCRRALWNEQPARSI